MLGEIAEGHFFERKNERFFDAVEIDAHFEVDAGVGGWAVFLSLYGLGLGLSHGYFSREFGMWVLLVVAPSGEVLEDLFEGGVDPEKGGGGEWEAVF